MWRRICSNPAMWQVVDIRYSYTLFDYDFNIKEVAKQAVDLSSGQMVDFTIKHFASDDLLRYFFDRSCQLRRLHLVSCNHITDEGLSEMSKKLPLLEELHLHECDIRVSKQAIEVVGRCCPQLKSFSLNRQNFSCPHYDFNEEALAIAENMPGLRHLQLHGNMMTSLGLVAILENCLHLESLDIRWCFFVAHLGPDMKISQLIKNIRLPLDYIVDYEFSSDIYNSSEVDYSYRLPVISGGSDIDSDSE